jgi:hypothetical protein
MLTYFDASTCAFDWASAFESELVGALSRSLGSGCCAGAGCPSVGADRPPLSGVAMSDLLPLELHGRHPSVNGPGAGGEVSPAPTAHPTHGVVLQRHLPLSEEDNLDAS